MIEITNSFDNQQWDEFVRNHPHGNIFQTTDMAEVYRQTKNYNPVSLAAIDLDSGEILAVLQAVIIREIGGLLRSLSARSVIQGGPLVVEGKGGLEAAAKLMEHYDGVVRKKVVYTQIRNMWDTQDVKTIMQKAGYSYVEHLNYLIDLNKDKKELWINLFKSRRNGITKSYRLGSSLEEFSDMNSVEKIYKQLQETYSHAKIPLADITLFKSIVSELVPKNMAKIWVAKYDDKVIGTIVTLTYKGTIYDWYAGSSREYLKLCPNDILPWNVIEWGSKNQFNIFDFGGAGKPTESYGVREFKKQFGGKLVNFGRYEKSHSKFKTTVTNRGYKLYKMISRI
jgi:lipid II:glycine glycyltransferase (peptidoglycan interpeptide bridge formation enzyme)